MSHLAHIVLEGFVSLLDIAFLAGLAGCVVVLVMTFVEDLETLFRP